MSSKAVMEGLQDPAIVTQPYVSVVIPAFNEASILRSHLEELLRYTASLADRYQFELIIVNDGSSDATGTIARGLAAAHDCIVALDHPSNRGLGAALRTAISRAHGDFIVPVDIDLSYSLDQIGVLLQTAVDQHADIVIASPYVRGGTVRNVPWGRKVMSAWANRFLSVAARGRIATLTGMVRVYSARALERLSIRTDGMEVNHQLVFDALKQNMRIVEVPARLQWTTQTATSAGSVRRSSMRVAKHAWRVVSDGVAFRPSMVLAIPALIPGLLPFVIMVVLLAHPAQATIVRATLITLIVQFSSLGFLILGTTDYLFRRRSLNRRPVVHASGGQTRAY